MFQVDLGIKSFSEADLHSLNTVVEGFLTAYKGASHDMAALRAGPSTLPHLHTVVATRVAELNLPALFVELACRGVADFPAAAPADWDTLGAERTAAAAAMLSTPRALYLRDVQSNGLLPLVQGDAPDGWFDPTKVTPSPSPRPLRRGAVLPHLMLCSSRHVVKCPLCTCAVVFGQRPRSAHLTPEQPSRTNAQTALAPGDVDRDAAHCEAAGGAIRCRRQVQRHSDGHSGGPAGAALTNHHHTPTLGASIERKACH